MTELETFILGIVMASTMDPTREDECDFALWCRFWDAAHPAWNRAAHAYGWRFESSLLWNPSRM